MNVPNKRTAARLSRNLGEALENRALRSEEKGAEKARRNEARQELNRRQQVLGLLEEAASLSSDEVGVKIRLLAEELTEEFSKDGEALKEAAFPPKAEKEANA